jgi:hypothetical protein
MTSAIGEIEATARAYVGAAVTELATFRAELAGQPVAHEGRGKIHPWRAERAAAQAAARVRHQDVRP